MSLHLYHDSGVRPLNQSVFNCHSGNFAEWDTFHRNHLSKHLHVIGPWLHVLLSMPHVFTKYSDQEGSVIGPEPPEIFVDTHVKHEVLVNLSPLAVFTLQVLCIQQPFKLLLCGKFW